MLAFWELLAGTALVSPHALEPVDLAQLDRTPSAVQGAEALSDLVVVAGDWQTEGTVVRAGSPDEVYGRAFIAGRSWIDCVVEATVTLEGAGDEPWAGLRLIIRGDPDNGNLTTVGFWCGARSVAIEQATGLAFETLKNSTVPAQAPFTLERGRPYRVVVVADRAAYYCFIDGQYIVHAVEPTFASRPSGQVGFHAARATGTFRDVTVRPLQRSRSPFVYHPANPLNLEAYSPTVIRDEGRYRMWFTTRGQSYAESADGLHWTQPYGGEPVKPLGTRGGWGDEWDADAEVVRAGEAYLMSHAGCSSLTGGAWDGMGFHHSADGRQWRAEPGNPLLYMGPVGAWDENVIGDHSFIRDGDVWKMWYTGINQPARGYRNEFGYAESADGLHWRRCTLSPVLTQGQPGDWDGGWIYAASVLKLGDEEPQTRVYAGHGGSYHLFYTGQPTNDETVGGVKRLGWAFSLDGIHWAKYDDATTTDPPFHHSDPILTWTDWGTWGHMGVRACSAIRDGDEVKVWFSGEGTSYTGTGLATAKVADLLRVVERARVAGQLPVMSREEIEATLHEPLPLSTWDDLAAAALAAVSARAGHDEQAAGEALQQAEGLMRCTTRSEQTYLQTELAPLSRALDALAKPQRRVAVRHPWSLDLAAEPSFRPAYLNAARFDGVAHGAAAFTALGADPFVALPPMDVPVDADLCLVELQVELARPGTIAVRWSLGNEGVLPGSRVERRIRWPEQQRRLYLVMPWPRGGRVGQLRLDLPDGQTTRLRAAAVHLIRFAHAKQ